MHQVLSMKRSQTSVKNHMTQSMRMRQQGQNKGRMNVSQNDFLQNDFQFENLQKLRKSDFCKIEIQYAKSEFY